MANRSDFSNEARRQPSDRLRAEYEPANDEITTWSVQEPTSEDELAYEEGYVQGRKQERIARSEAEDIRRNRDANSLGAGAIIGVLMATVAGLILAMLYLTPRQQTVTDPTVSPTVNPVANPTAPVSPSGAASLTPVQPQTGTQPASPVPNVTIIEPAQPVQPQVVQPSIPVQPSVQPQVVQPQVLPSSPAVTQPVPSTGQAVPQTSPAVPPTTGPTDPYQSPQPSVITPPGSLGQP